MERAWRQKAGSWRAEVVHTATGRVLYVTWPYSSEGSARDRAQRWMREEYEKAEKIEFFGSKLSG